MYTCLTCFYLCFLSMISIRLHCTSYTGFIVFCIASYINVVLWLKYRKWNDLFYHKCLLCWQFWCNISFFFYYFTLCSLLMLPLDELLNVSVNYVRPKILSPHWIQVINRLNWNKKAACDIILVTFQIGTVHDTDSYLLEDLKPTTRYSLYVTSVGSHHESQKSNVITVETEEAKPRAVPHKGGSM